MQQQMALQGSGRCQAVLSQTFPCRSARTSVLRQTQARRAARSRGSQTATTGSDTWSSSEGGSDTDDSDSEASSGGRGTRPVRRQQQRTGRGQQVAPAIESSSDAAAAAAAAAASGPAIPAASCPDLAEQEPSLHQPYSHLVWCNSHMQFDRKHTRGLTIAAPLCTDIEELQSMKGSCSVQVYFVKHPADWGVKGYIKQHPVMQQQQQAVQAPPSAAGSTSTTPSIGPLVATLTHAAQGRMRLTELPILSTVKQECGGAPHALVLQERLSSSDGHCFALHVVPVSTDPESAYQHKRTTVSNYSRMLSRAGQGPGVQVFPGSVKEVAKAGKISTGQKVSYTIPQVLVCSQVPAGTTFPLKMTLTLMGCPGQGGQASPQLGTWQVTAGKHRGSQNIRLNSSHPLAVYIGRSIATASLLQDTAQGFLLTLTLADTAVDPARAPPAPTAELPSEVTTPTAAANAGSSAPTAAPVDPSASAKDNAGPSSTHVLIGHPPTAQIAVYAIGAAAAAHHPLLGAVPPSHPSSAPSQQRPALLAKRPAAQLEGSEQQGTSSVAAAAPCVRVSAAARQPATPNSSKKPRLHLLPPAGAAGTTFGPNSQCHTMSQAVAAVNTHDSFSNSAAGSALAGPAAADQGCSLMQVDPPAQQQQRHLAADPQQQQQQQQAPLQLQLQQQQPGASQTSPGWTGAAAAVPALPAALPAAAAAPQPAADVAPEAPASTGIQQEEDQAITLAAAHIPALPAVVAAGQSMVNAPAPNAAAAPALAPVVVKHEAPVLSLTAVPDNGKQQHVSAVQPPAQLQAADAPGGVAPLTPQQQPATEPAAAALADVTEVGLQLVNTPPAGMAVSSPLSRPLFARGRTASPAAPAAGAAAAAAEVPVGVKQEAPTLLPDLTAQAPTATAAAGASSCYPRASVPTPVAAPAAAPLLSSGAGPPPPLAAAPAEQDTPAQGPPALEAAATSPAVTTAAAGRHSTAPVAAAAAAPGSVVVKQEAVVVDLTADSDDEEERGEQQQQQQQQQPANPNSTAAAPPPRLASPASTAPSQHIAPAPAAAGGRAAEQNAAPAPAATPPAVPAAPGSLTPVTTAVPQQLPAGLALPGAASPQQMELQLGELLTEGLQQLLPEAQYWSMLDQLREAFDPYRLAAAVGSEQQQQQNQQQHLRLMYTYVQAAVRSGRLDRVVGALESLVAAACTFGRAVHVNGG